MLIEDALKSLDKEFGHLFYRIHRTALVSLAPVGGMQSGHDNTEVTFQDIERVLEISRRNQPGIRKIIKNL